MSNERTPRLFDDLEPSLVSIARKFGISDPSGEARSWYMKFSEIMDKFSSGQLSREIHREDGTIEAITGPPTAEQTPDFEASIKSYLRKAFRNDCIQAYNKGKRLVSLENNPSSALKVPTPMPCIATEAEVIKVSDLIRVIESDCARKRKNVSVARDQVNYHFLASILKFYKKFQRDYGDMPIVRNLASNESREFFIFDTRDGRTDVIGQYLSDRMATEPARAVVRCSQKLLNPEKGYFTLNRKISRYFNDTLGGMPSRLKKLKIGLLDENGEIDI